MSGKIKKIDRIKGLAVFTDFLWNSVVRDEGNNVAEFKKISILYGRNYSGKTTLSRVFRALETGHLSDRFDAPEFQLSLDGLPNIDQNTLLSHGQSFRVFNEDFVKENLKFIANDEETINSFAILGEDNARLEQEIDELEVELGNEEDKTGLAGELSDATATYNSAKKDHNVKTEGLEDKLKSKANKAGSGIKHNKTFGDANYNITKIKGDITTVLGEDYSPLSEGQVTDAYNLLREEPKQEIAESQNFKLAFSAIKGTVEELVEKKIQSTDSIPELLADAALTAWVRSGRTLHEGERETCGFCGNDLPLELWQKLDKHFNRESEQLRTDIDQAITSIDTEERRVLVNKSGHLLLPLYE